MIWRRAQCRRCHRADRCILWWIFWAHFVVLVVSGFVNSFAASRRSTTLNNIALALSSQQSDAIVELQSDSSLYGRGEFHLSANLDVDDVVVVQVGSWLVDGVLVGDDSTDPTLKYVRVDTIQVVWTHNCEHGVLRGTELEVLDDGISLVPRADPIEFGPEQLIGRLNQVEWNKETNISKSPIPLSEDLWPIMTEWTD